MQRIIPVRKAREHVTLEIGPCGGSLRGGVQTRISWFKSRQGLHSLHRLSSVACMAKHAFANI